MAGFWVEQLYSVLQTDPFKKKIILSSGFAQGHQWLEQMARNYGPVMNTEVHTLESHVIAAVQQQMALQGITYVTERETFWIVHQLMGQLAVETNSYVPESMLTPGVIHSFHKAVTELRHVGVLAAKLLPQQFENAENGHYLIRLLSSFEGYLVEQKRVDFPGLLAILPEKQNANLLYITSEYMRFTAIEREMLKKLTGSNSHFAASSSTMLISESLVNLPGELSLDDENSHFPVEDCEFVHTTGSLAEVREVFRRLAEKQLSWDQVEVIASDYSTYASANFCRT